MKVTGKIEHPDVLTGQVPVTPDCHNPDCTECHNCPCEEPTSD